MKIGNFKFGNDYKFDVKNVVRHKNEDFNKLNKIELRYNTRKNLPSYPAMKSLYRWRSVFGYKLGGILRQGVVKLAEVKRPIINTGRLLSSLAGDGLHTYKRLYSTRQVFNAVRSANPGRSDVKLLKYMSFGQFPEKNHSMASSRDHSVRNAIMQKFMAISQNKQTERFLNNQNNLIDKYNENNLDMNAKPIPRLDVNVQMEGLKEQESDLSIHWKAKKEEITSKFEDRKDRIAFKFRDQKARLGQFFKDWSNMGPKNAYSNLVEQSKKDEQDYQARFNPQGTYSPRIVHYDIGDYGEKVLKEFDGGKKPQEDYLPPLNTKAYPYHLEDLAEYDDKLRDRLAEIRKNLGMDRPKDQNDMDHI